MRCAFCSNDETRVLDKRDHEGITKRRRECLKCDKRFTTYERVENLNLTVIKKDGRKEIFDREKLKAGLLKAFEKRPITLEKIDEIINKIEICLRKLKTNEIYSKNIGERVIKELKKVDDVAYLRFASVYKNFKDCKDFENEMKEVK